MLTLKTKRNQRVPCLISSTMNYEALIHVHNVFSVVYRLIAGRFSPVEVSSSEVVMSPDLTN